MLGVGALTLFGLGVWLRAAIFKALSPHYMFLYWRDEGQTGWAVMSGVLLCITGVEAMFADLGHFSRPAVQVRACVPGLSTPNNWEHTLKQ